MRIFVVIASLLALVGTSHARPQHLERLPPDKLIGLEPLLKHGDIALVESHPDGKMKQVTLILFVQAKPETVHEVISHPGDFKNFIPNVTKSSWEPRQNGGVSSWKLDLPVSSFWQTNIYKFEPGPTGGIDITCPTDGEDATYRWEFWPAPGGTVLVMYGYTDVKHSNAFVHRFIDKMPVTEHGLALAAQLMLAANMRREAERRAAKEGVPPVLAGGEGKSSGFGFLLERGQVAVMRSLPDGRLGDISLLDRFYAPLSSIADALAHPGAWSSFIPGVDESDDRGRSGDVIRFHTDFAIPLVTWSTTWDMRVTANAFDGAGVDGDLNGARFRWDLTAKGPNETLVVYRVNERLTDGSTLFRKLVEMQPALEHGLTVAFSLVYLRAIRAKAEKWK